MILQHYCIVAGLVTCVLNHHHLIHQIDGLSCVARLKLPYIHKHCSTNFNLNSSMDSVKVRHTLEQVLAYLDRNCTINSARNIKYLYGLHSFIIFSTPDEARSGKEG